MQYNNAAKEVIIFFLVIALAANAKAIYLLQQPIPFTATDGGSSAFPAFTVTFSGDFIAYDPTAPTNQDPNDRGINPYSKGTDTWIDSTLGSFTFSDSCLSATTLIESFDLYYLHVSSPITSNTNPHHMGFTIMTAPSGTVCVDGKFVLAPFAPDVQISGANSILEIGEPLYEEKPSITAADSPALLGGSLGSSSYSHTIYLGDQAQTSQLYVDNTIDDDDDDDIPADYLYIPSGEEVYEYNLAFSPAATLQIQNQVLVGLDGQSLNGIKVLWHVLKARRSAQNNIELTLFAPDVDDTLQQGIAHAHILKEGIVVVSATSVTSSSAQFGINGWQTPLLASGDTATSPVGVKIAYRKTVGNNAYFSLGSAQSFNKMVISDTDITNPNIGGSLTVDSENIEDMFVVITGTDSGSAVSLSDIRLTLLSDDDNYIAQNECVTENIGEPQGMIPRFNICFNGLTQENAELFGLLSEPNSNIRLSFTNRGGDDTDVTLYSVQNNNQLKLGDATGNFEISEGSTIDPQDEFILSFDTPGYDTTYSHVFRYVSTDAVNNIVSFQDLTTGNNVDIAYSDVSANTQLNPSAFDAVIIVGGHQFNVDVLADTPTTGLYIDLNGNGNRISGELGNKVVTQYKMVFSVNQPSGAAGSAQLQWPAEIIEAATSPQTVSFNVLAANNFVSFSNFQQVSPISVPASHAGYYPGIPTTAQFVMRTIGTLDEKMERSILGSEIHQDQYSTQSHNLGLLNPAIQKEALVAVKLG